MISFPTFILKNNKRVHSKEELVDMLKEATKVGKNPEVAFYGFSSWDNCDPILESVILDKLVYQGDEEKLRELANKKNKEGYDSILLFDGEHTYLIILENIETINNHQEQGVTLITNTLKKFVFPGYLNLKTNKKSVVLEMYKGK